MQGVERLIEKSSSSATAASTTGPRVTETVQKTPDSLRAPQPGLAARYYADGLDF